MTVHTLPDEPDGIRVLRASGELDVAALPPLLPTVPDIVAGAAAVVLDLTDVTFFDSSGVRFVDALARASARLRVVAPVGGIPRRVLEIVGLADALVDDDLATALAAVRP